MNETAFLDGYVPPEINPPHRRSAYTQEFADDVCDRIAAGGNFKELCLTVPGYPPLSTAYRWRDNNPYFKSLYAAAMRWRDETLAWDAETIRAELLKIADDKTDDYEHKDSVDGGVPAMLVNKTAIQRSTVQIKTRQWLMAKLAPHKYGEVAVALPALPAPSGDDAKLVQHSPLVIEHDPLRDSLIAFERATTVKAS